MKKFCLAGCFLMAIIIRSIAGAYDTGVTSNKIEDIPAELFEHKSATSARTDTSDGVEKTAIVPKFERVKEPVIDEKAPIKLRMAEIKSDGIISVRERTEYEAITANFDYPDFPIVTNQVSETEPNDDCYSANTVVAGDTIWCAYLDGTGLTDTCDYFTFTLDTTFSSWLVELETHDASICGTAIGDTKLYLYTSDCADTLAKNDDGGIGNYSKITKALYPGTYKIAVTPYWNVTTGYYHLSVLATGLVYNVGDHCDNPIPVNLPADLPYVDSNQTISGRIDYYNGVTCMIDYDNNEEIIYQLSVTSDGWYNITLDPVETSLTGMSLGTDCPPTNCLFFARTYGGRVISQFTYLEAGVGTYYMMVDRQASSGGLTFDLAIDSISAPPAGEICYNAIEIPNTANYTDTRNQSLYNNDYGYHGKDVVYSFSVSESKVLTFSLCNSSDDWNSVLRLFDDFSCGVPEQELYLIEEPRCYSSMHAKMSYICDPGNYYLVVDAAYDTPNEGWYTLEISEQPVPCTDPYFIPPNDNCADVSPVTIPPGSTYVFTGNNCNATGDCPSYAWPQVWEAFTTLETADITIDYCGTAPAWNRSYISLMSACPCTSGIEYIPSNYNNYTACPDGNVTLQYEAIPAGTYYYPVLNHPYDYSWGDYVLNVHISGPCDVTFPPGGIYEGEPLCVDDYIDDYNGGCNSEPPVFQPINNGDAIFGVTGMFWDSLGYEARDTDWYEYVADDWYSLEFKVVSESPIQAIIEDGNYECVPHPFDMEFGNDCDTIYTYASVQPGRYWMFVAVAPWGSEFECPQEYTAILTATPEAPHYCEPCFHDDTGDYISSVSFGSINNITGSEGDPCSYGDYTSISTQVEQYGTYNLTVSVESDTSYQHVRAWIDWDQDLIFEDDEYYYLGGGYSPVVVSSDITVPGDAIPGQTRMRVIERRWGIDDEEPCTPGFFGRGETEDYTIEVVAGTPPVFSAYPATIEGSADEGEIDTELLTVTNNGVGDLVFEVTVLLNPPAPGVTEITMEFPQNARLLSAKKKNYQPEINAPLDPGLILQGGDDISAAEPITSIPSTVSGTTVGYNDDYYEACPLAVDGGLDVVYEYSSPADEYVSLTLCIGNTDFDTRMYIYEDSATAGSPYACNEDNCSSPVFPYAWISAIEDVLMVAGHIYYIVIDGYDSNSSGNYVLDVYPGSPPPEPETCGNDSTLILSQDPDDPADGFTSESDLGYKVYENFNVYGEVTDITWWGFDSFNNFYNWLECDIDVDTFEINFHHDDNGYPGTIIQACTLSVSGELTGHVFWDLFEEKRYSVSLPEPVFLAGEGWLSIQALTEGDYCWFLWATSHAGDFHGLQYNGMTYYLLDSDLAVCLSGTHFAEWLTIDNTEGVIQTGQFADINVTMNAGNLTGGTYSGNIDFDTNDPGNPTPTVPVAFYVIGSGCDYAVGDVNGSGGYNGLDITYGVAFFKGNPAPLCDPCSLCPDWHYCGDVNGSCNYNGLDITYGVAYFKGGPNPIPCNDCPPNTAINVNKNRTKQSLQHRGEGGFIQTKKPEK